MPPMLPRMPLVPPRPNGHPSRPPACITRAVSSHQPAACAGARNTLRPQSHIPHPSARIAARDHSIGLPARARRRQDTLRPQPYAPHPSAYIATQRYPIDPPNGAACAPDILPPQPHASRPPVRIVAWGAPHLPTAFLPPSTACPSPIGPYRRLGGALSAHRLPPLSTARPSPIGPYRRTGGPPSGPPPVPVSAPPTGRPLLPRLSPPASARLRAVGHHCCLWGPLTADGSLTTCMWLSACGLVVCRLRRPLRGPVVHRQGLGTRPPPRAAP